MPSSANPETIPPRAESTSLVAPEEEVALEKTRLLFDNAGMAQAVTAINASLLLIALGTRALPAWSIGWWVLAMAVAGGRYLLARRFVAAAPSPADEPRWRLLATRGALIAGLTWAAGTSAMMLSDPGATRMLAALISAGMVAGAVSILSAVPGAFRAYAVPVMLAIVATAVFDAQQSSDWLLAIVAVLFLLALIRSAALFHGSLDHSIRLALHMRHMAEELDVARRGAEAASLAKSQFLAAMSHEIRTPLNGILGMAQVLLMPGSDERERQDYARTILNSGHTLLTLLNDILDLSKVEAGKYELKASAFSPAQLLDEVSVLFVELARDKGLEFSSYWRGETAARYEADASRLRQMLSNLVNNGIKFTASGSVVVEAREIADSDGPLLEFAVRDTGIGIAAEKQVLLFEPFSQVDGSNTRQYGGTGLGLSIVRGLAEQMGGSAGVISEAGSGAIFWFRVRARRLENDSETRAMAREARIAAEVGGETPREPLVLVVEDNEINRLVAQTLLQRLHCRVRLAEDGHLAVAAIAEGLAPDLVLMDLHMPEMDGIEATRRIRDWEAQGAPAVDGRRLPIVALTADAFAEDRERCLACGMDDFLPKPLVASELARVLERWTAPANPAWRA